MSDVKKFGVDFFDLLKKLTVVKKVNAKVVTMVTMKFRKFGIVTGHCSIGLQWIEYSW